MDVATSYRTKESTSESDSDDSDREFNDWKRAPVRVSKTESLEPVPNEPVLKEALPQQNKKRKLNNIWSDVLQDQLISDDLHHCGIKRKPKGYGSRGHESYDYTLRYSDPRLPQPMEDDRLENGASEDSDTNSFKSSTSKNTDNKYVKLDSTELQAAKKIVRVLQEKKFYLIFRVVKYLGIEKAVSLLKMTEDIEESGGMLIKNQARRRTPGGVYFQLLKTDKDVSKDSLDKIFEGELGGYDAKKYFDELRQKRKGHKKKKKKKKSKPQNSIKLEQEEKKPSIGVDDQAVKDENEIDMSEASFMKDEACTKQSSDSNLEDGEINE